MNAVEPGRVHRMLHSSWHGALARAAHAIGAPLIGVLFATSPITAQSVQGRLTDEGSGGPIPAAMIVLFDSTGTQQAAVLTTQSGTFELRAPRPGTYWLRVLRIGYEQWNSEPVTLAYGLPLSYPIAMPLRPIQLAEIAVEADAGHRCWGDPSEGARLAAVWGEVTKALTVARWTAGQPLYRYTTRLYQRDLSETGRRVLSEQSTSETANFVTPFMSRPPQELSERGYFELGEEQSLYFAPDANALLSDAFITDHCFSTRTREADGQRQIGLTFSPIPERHQPEVEGVLWLDEETAELTGLEFRYVNFPYEFRGRDRIGGHIAFERLPSGAWVVREWNIRMPVLGLRYTQTRAEPEIVLRGLTESGGEIAEILSPSGERIFRAPVATLTGTVFDNTGGAGLAAATIVISGTDYVTTSDEDGRFAMDVPLRGNYQLAVAHPQLDSLGATLTAPVELLPGAVTARRMAMPSLDEALTQLCEGPADPSRRILFGTVRSNAGAVAGANVTMTWSGFAVAGNLIRQAAREAVAVTDGDGRWTACGVPVDRRVVLTASFAGQRSRAAVAHFGAGTALLDGQRFDTTRPMGRIDLELIEPDRFTASVAGRVSAAETSEPLPEAVVEIVGVAASVTTDASGAFRIGRLPPGRHMLTVRAVGYDIVERTIDVRADATATIADSLLALGRRPVELDPVVATARAGRRDLASAGFYERQTAGVGSFIERVDIERAAPLETTDILRRMPGIRVRRNPNYGKEKPGRVSALGRLVEEGDGSTDFRRWLVETTRTAVIADGECPVNIFLNGVFVGSALDTFVDDLIDPTQIEAIEAFAGLGQIPPQFNRSGPDCGVIVIWTR